MGLRETGDRASHHGLLHCRVQSGTQGPPGHSHPLGCLDEEFAWPGRGQAVPCLVGGLQHSGCLCVLYPGLPGAPPREPGGQSQIGGKWRACAPVGQEPQLPLPRPLTSGKLPSTMKDLEPQGITVPALPSITTLQSRARELHYRALGLGPDPNSLLGVALPPSQPGGHPWGSSKRTARTGGKCYSTPYTVQGRKVMFAALGSRLWAVGWRPVGRLLLARRRPPGPSCPGEMGVGGRLRTSRASVPSTHLPHHVHKGLWLQWL